LAASGAPNLLDIAFEIMPATPSLPSLHGSGLVVANPPFVLESELRVLLPALHKLLMVEAPSRWTLEWLAGEAA
jgi:23S rRNA (adenine2030-N6)-methyltransferase